MAYQDVLLLGNDCIIPRQTADSEINRLAARILDEIVEPMKEVQMDDTELACLKTIVFFDPGKLLFIHRYYVIFCDCDVILYR